MKSRELLKLNERQSIVEIEKGNTTEYCVCSYYDDNKPEGSKWTWGHYFLTLEDAIKYAATKVYTPIHQYVVVVSYSFDAEKPVWFFDTEEEAVAEIRKQFEEEKRIQIEENGHVLGEDIVCYIDESGDYAKISIDFEDEADVMEWTIGDIKNY